MRIVTNSLLLLSMVCVSTAAFAAGQMKPGLWDMTIKSDAIKDMPKMPKMSPEQMEQMKKMGITLPSMNDGAIAIKVCMSKEMVERDEPPQVNSKESGCQSKNYQRSATGYSADVICDSADMKGQGRATGTFSGNEKFSSTYDFKGTAHGKPMVQHMETNGKWLGADCGSVKAHGEHMKPPK